MSQVQRRQFTSEQKAGDGQQVLNRAPISNNAEHNNLEHAMPEKPRGFGGRAPKDEMCNIPYSFHPEICPNVSYIKKPIVHFTVNQDTASNKA